MDFHLKDRVPAEVCVVILLQWYFENPIMALKAQQTKFSAVFCIESLVGHMNIPPNSA